MDKLSKGDRVAVVDTWTDGEDVWVQVGPERWAAIFHDDKASIELIPG
jgi:hypothetical protein